MRRTILTLALTVAALGAGTAWLAQPTVTAAAAEGGGHPHFADQGVLTWSTKLADAQKAAKKQGKLVLIEYGREA